MYARDSNTYGPLRWMTSVLAFHLAQHNGLASIYHLNRHPAPMCFAACQIDSLTAVSPNRVISGLRWKLGRKGMRIKSHGDTLTAAMPWLQYTHRQKAPNFYSECASTRPLLTSI